MHTHNQRICFLQQGSQLHGKGVVAAHVTARLHSVQQHYGFLIHCAKVQKESPTLGQEAVGQDELAAVPQSLSGHERAPHAAERAFRRKRHQDGAVIRLRLHVVIGEGVFPAAIEV